MILLLDTSTPVCHLSFTEGDWRVDATWQADRTLAKGLLGYINSQLVERGKTWQDVSGIGVLRGPGSFTGLRIGMTVVNTIADSLNIPIVGGIGDQWQGEVIEKLRAGENDKMILPEYGGDAHITKPRK